MNRRVILGILSAALLAGCASEDLTDLEQRVQQIKSREPGQIEPLPEIKQIETYVYNAADRRSPFSLGGGSVEEDSGRSSSGIKPNPLRRKEELEQFPLDSIRMVGSLEQDDSIWALVTAREGVLYRVKAGNYMGQNHGQITRIAEDRIELTEIVPEGTNGWQERQASIALSE
jgi:type IV pilus assembly protein PilP